MHALTVHFNEHGPFIAVCDGDETLALGLTLTEENWLRLKVNVGRGDTERSVVLGTVGPGDSLRLRFDVLTESVPESIQGLALHEKRDAVCSLPEGHRIGLVIRDAPGSSMERLRDARISHSEHGSFQLLLGTIPKDHARVFVMAGDDVEDWHWQLPDLRSGESLALEVIETTWCSPFPRVSPVDGNDDAAGLAILFRTSPEGALHSVRHSLHFGAEQVAKESAERLRQSGFSTNGPWGFATDWHLTVEHRIVPTLASLSDARAQLSALAAQAEYCGWEASS